VTCRESISLLLLLFGASTTLAQAVLPPFPLSSPRGTATGFGLVEIRGETDLAMISDAVMVFESRFEGLHEVVVGEVPILDLSDFDRRTSGGEIIPGDALPMLGREPLEEEIPNTVNVAHGRLRVAEAGQYTIQVHSSDGFAMRFPGHEWEQVFSWQDETSAEIDSHDPETLLFRKRTGDANTRGVISLPEGDIDFEFVHFGGGFSYLTGIYFEVTSAIGVHEYQAPAQWLPLGVGSVVPALAGAPRDVQLTEPALLVAAEGIVREVEDLRSEIEFARESLPNRVVELNQLVVVDEDGVEGRDVCCTRPALALPALESTVIPYGDRTTFTGLGLFAQFEVNDGDNIPNEEIPLTFALFADDYAHLRIRGESFESGSEFIELGQMIGSSEIIDQGMTAFLTEMRQHPLGYIELAEGEYELETHLYQQGFDSGLEVWVATGTHDRFDLNVFYPLGLNKEVTARPRNVGLQLVDATEELLGDFDGDGEHTVADIDELTLAILKTSTELDRYDLDANMVLDFGDLDAFLSLANRVSGDADLNGEVSFADFLVLSANFGKSMSSTWSEGDFDLSGIVDFADFLVLSSNFGHSNPAQFSVPEPSGNYFIVFAFISICQTLSNRQRRTKV